MKHTATVVVISVVLMGFVSMATATHEIFEPGNVRDTDYIGSSTVMHLLNEDCAATLGEPECPTRIPRGIIDTVCDYSSQGVTSTGGLYKGLGGAIFCQVQKSLPEGNETFPAGRDSNIRIKYEDISVFDPLGMVTCQETVVDESTNDVTTWHREIAELEGNDVWVTLTVPDWCDNTGGHDDRTDIGLFNFAADIRAGVAVGGAIEGIAHLEVLNPLDEL